MDPSHFDRLSDGQKQCLRLLFANLSIKEIGRELDVSPNTIKARLKAARRLLGASSSMMAAIMLVRHEHDTLGIDPPRSLGIERQLSDQADAAGSPTAPRVVRNRYSYGILQRIGLIIAIAFGAVALASSLLGGFEMIAKVFHAERIDLSDPPYQH